MLKCGLQALELFNLRQISCLRVVQLVMPERCGLFVNMVSIYPTGTSVSLHFDLFKLCGALQSEPQND